MIPTFFVSVFSFVFILLIFQTLKLTDTLLQHSIGFSVLFQLLSYMSISFLPVIFPMSLIFSIVLTYNRLSSDSEIIAMKSLGLGLYPIMAPGITLGLIVAIISCYTSFKIGPWGQRRFDLLITEITSSKIITSIRENTFSSFFDMVIYSNKINRKTKEHEKVFIHDERDPSNPTTIVAEKGKFFGEKTPDSYQAFVRLSNGHLHKSVGMGHTKIHFKTYKLQITEPTHKKNRDQSLFSLTYKELKKRLKETKDLHQTRKLKYEWHKRLGLSFACVLFALLGMGLGCRNSNRGSKFNGGVISVVIIVSYWLFFLIGNSLTRSSMPIWFCAWLPVLVLLPLAFFFIGEKRV